MKTTELQMFSETVQYINQSIAVKPFCQFFGLDFQNQTERIKRDPILSQLYGNFRTTGADSKQYLMFCLTKRGFIRWIDRISPQNVEPELREKFISFQILIDDYLNGSAEEQKLIGELNTKLQDLQLQYSAIGNSIKTTRRQLFAALNKRYQYSLTFEETSAPVPVEQPKTPQP